MKISRTIASLLPAAALLLTLAFPAAAANPKPAPSPAPAAHDFGGHRVEAIKAIDQAIHQLEICLQYDKD